MYHPQGMRSPRMGSPAPMGGRSPVSVSPGPMGQSPGPASSSRTLPPGLKLPIGAGDQRRSSLPANSLRVSTSGKPPSAPGARSPSGSTTPRTPRFHAQHLVMDRDSPKSGGGPGMASPRTTGPLMLNESETEEGIFGIGLRVDVQAAPHDVKSHNLLAPNGTPITEVSPGDVLTHIDNIELSQTDVALETLIMGKVKDSSITLGFTKGGPFGKEFQVVAKRYIPVRQWKRRRTWYEVVDRGTSDQLMCSKSLVTSLESARQAAQDGLAELTDLVEKTSMSNSRRSERVCGSLDRISEQAPPAIATSAQACKEEVVKIEQLRIEGEKAVAEFAGKVTCKLADEVASGLAMLTPAVASNYGEYEQRIRSLEMELALEQDRVGQTEHQLCVERDRGMEYREKIRALEGQLTGLSIKLDQEMSEEERLRLELEQQKLMSNQLQHDLEVEKGEEEKLRRQLKAEQEEEDRLKHDLEVEKDEEEKLKRQLKAEQEADEKLRRQLEEERMRKSVEDAILEKQKELVGREKAIYRKADANDHMSLSDEIDVLRSKLDAYRSETARQTARAEAADITIKEQEDLITSLKARIFELDRQHIDVGFIRLKLG